MSGVSRFWELNSLFWRYSRDENVTSFDRFTHLLRENATAPSSAWLLIGRIQAFERITLRPTPRVKFADKVYIFKRSDSQTSQKVNSLQPVAVAGVPELLHGFIDIS